MYGWIGWAIGLVVGFAISLVVGWNTDLEPVGSFFVTWIILMVFALSGYFLGRRYERSRQF